MEVSISFDYPNGDFDFKLLEFRGMDDKKASVIMTNIKNRADMIGAMGEGGIMEIVQCGAREMEDYEQYREDAVKRKNLFELREEEQQRKQLEEETKLKEESKLQKQKEKIELEKKEKEVQDRYLYMRGGGAGLEQSGSRRQSIWTDKLKKQKIGMNEDNQLDLNVSNILTEMNLSKAGDSPEQNKISVLQSSGGLDTQFSKNESNVSRFNEDFEQITTLG